MRKRPERREFEKPKALKVAVLVRASKEEIIKHTDWKPRKPKSTKPKSVWGDLSDLPKETIKNSSQRAKQKKGQTILMIKRVLPTEVAEQQKIWEDPTEEKNIPVN